LTSGKSKVGVRVIVAVGVTVGVEIIVAVKVMLGEGEGVVVASLTGVGESRRAWVGGLCSAKDGGGEDEVDAKLEIGKLQPLNITANATERPASVISG
jgi:hypothetical protein